MSVELEYYGLRVSYPKVRSELELDIVREILTEDQAKDFLEQPENVALAPVMPMRVISPAIRSELSKRKNTKRQDTWGRIATGAVAANHDGLTGKGVTVAVLDTGIIAKHDAFSHMLSDQIIEDFYIGRARTDSDGHGTHTAATIFGNYVENCRVGVAPHIDKAIIGKVAEGSFSDTAVLADAIVKSNKKGAHIISMSLGLSIQDFIRLVKNECDCSDAEATRLAAMAHADNVALYQILVNTLRGDSGIAGSLLISAAGNGSARPGMIADLEFPALVNGIIAVGSLKEVKKNRYHVAALSNDNVSVLAPGQGIDSADHADINSKVELSGTSMAVPHVAGIAALYAQQMFDQQAKNGERKLIDVAILEKLILDNAISDNITIQDHPTLTPGTRSTALGKGLVKAPS